MNLEIKHLVDYIPYGLVCYAMGEHVEGTEYDEDPEPIQFTLNGVVNNKVSLSLNGEPVKTIELHECFPLLKPLTEVKTDPDILWAFKEIHKEPIFMYTDCIDFSENKPFLTCPLFFYRLLLRLHYDVHGLIEEKLACNYTAHKLQKDVKGNKGE